MHRFLFVFGLLLSVLFLSSCNAKKDSELPQVYMGYTADYIYAQAHEQMQDKDYFDAIRSYKSLSAQYPFTKQAEQGMVDLIYVYYQNDEGVLSLALSEQFIKMYPYSKNKGYVYYLIGVIGFENGRGLLQKYGPYDMSHHDPSGYTDSYANFEKAIALDPEGSFVPDAKRRMIYINDTVAKYYFNIANFYYKRGAYNGAINRAAEIIRKYPQSSVVEGALVLTIKSYEKLNLQKQADMNTQVLKENYPKNKYLNNIEDPDEGFFSKWFGWL
jgi:outer membrane protein assembly factor BamD